MSLWAGTLGVTFESLLGHFNPFCVPVELGGRPLHNYDMLKIREEEGAQTQTFWSGYCRVGWGSST